MLVNSNKLMAKTINIYSISFHENAYYALADVEVEKKKILAKSIIVC